MNMSYTVLQNQTQRAHIANNTHRKLAAKSRDDGVAFVVGVVVAAISVITRFILREHAPLPPDYLIDTYKLIGAWTTRSNAINKTHQHPKK